MLVAALVAIVSFAFLIPLDSVPAVTGVSIILSIAYVISFIAWLLVLKFYSGKPESLQCLNTHLIFLVLLPATIGATAGRQLRPASGQPASRSDRAPPRCA